MKDFNDIINNKAFQCIEKEKLLLIEEIARKAKGKSAMEAIDIFTQYGPALTKGKALSAVERDAIIEVIKLGMSESEKKNLEQVLTMMRGMGKY